MNKAPRKVVLNGCIVFGSALILSFGGVASADRIYTWADKDGRIHMTQTPPPLDGDLIEVVQQSPNVKADDTEAAGVPTPGLPTDVQDAVNQAQELRRRADLARKEAAEAQAAADGAEREVEALRSRIGNYSRRMKKNRDRLTALEIEARKARQRALSAGQKAAAADKRADKAEKTAMEMLSQKPSP